LFSPPAELTFHQHDVALLTDFYLICALSGMSTAIPDYFWARFAWKLFSHILSL
jgi:hypothetical protein